MKLRRLLAMLLSLCLLLALAAVPALADGQEEPAGREELPLPAEPEALPSPAAAAEPVKGPEPELQLMEEWDFSVYAGSPVLTLDAAADVDYDGTALSGALLFTPAEDGVYRISSQSSLDTWAQLVDSDGNFVADNDDAGEGNNFSIKTTLTGGTTYVLLTRLYSSGLKGSYTVSAVRLAAVTDISMTLKPGISPLVMGGDNGSWYRTWDYDLGEYVPYFSFKRERILQIVNITGTADDGSTVVYDPVYPEDFSSVTIEYDCTQWTPGGANTFSVTLDSSGKTVSVSIPIMTFMDKYGSAPVMGLNTPSPVEYDGTTPCVLLFTPAMSGQYTFTAASEETLGTYAAIYDSDGTFLNSSGSGGENGNFMLYLELEAGKCYVLMTRRYEEALSGSYTVTAVRIPDIVSFTLTLNEGMEALYIGDRDCGSWYTYYDYGLEKDVPYFYFSPSVLLARVTVTAFFDDGTSAVLDLMGSDSDKAYYDYDCRRWASGGTENTFTVYAQRGSASAKINIPIISFMEKFAGRPSLALDTPQAVDYQGDFASGLFYFTPEVGGIYVFTAEGGPLDTYGEIYDGIGRHIISADYGGKDGHFSVQTAMEAGQTYAVVARTYSYTETGSFTVTATRLPNISELRLSLDEDAGLVTGVTYPGYMHISTSGYWETRHDPASGADVSYYQFGDAVVKAALNVTAVYEDGTVISLPDGKDDPRNELVYSYDCSAWTPGAAAGNTVTVTARLPGVSASIDVPVKSLAEYLRELNVPEAAAGVPMELFYDGESYSSAVLFTPDADGDYAVFTKSDMPSRLQVLDAAGADVKRKTEYDSGAGVWNTYALAAGETYVLYPVASSGANAGGFTFCVTGSGPIASLALSLVRPDAALVMGDPDAGSWSYAAADHYDFSAETVFSILEITAAFADGTVITLPYYSGLLTYRYSSFTPGGENLLTVTAGDASASISVPVLGAADLTAAVPDVPVEMEYDGTPNSGVVTFTPEADGDYWFYAEGSSDTWASVTNDRGDSLWNSDDEGSGSNFKVCCTLTAGTTYTVYSRTYDRRAGKYVIRVSPTEPAAAGYDGLKGMDLRGKMINLALVVDTTGSMTDEISNVRDALQGFVDALTETGATLRISLIDYKDVMADGFASTRVHASSAHSVWFANGDVDELKNAIARLYVDGGGDTPESVVDALGCLLDPDIMRFNSNAMKFVFLLTDANYWCYNNRGIKGMQELVTRLSDAGIITSVVTEKQYYMDYRILTAGTGGAFIDIRDDVSDAMSSFAASIAARAADYKPDDDVIPVTSVTLGEDLTIPVGRIRSFPVQVDPVNATNRSVIWEIADPSVAEIMDSTTSALLVIQGKKAGSTEITARTVDGDYTATFTLTAAKRVLSAEGVVESCDINEILAAVSEDPVIALRYYADMANNASVPEDIQRQLYLNLIGQSKDLSYIFSDGLGELSYSWTFTGTDITEETKGIAVSDMLIELDKADSPAAAALAQFVQADSVDFAHDGPLPAPAAIQIPVDLDDGVYELMYMNEVTGELELVSNVTVKDGVASFVIEHCSTYVIVDPRDAVIRVDGKRAGELAGIPAGDFTAAVKVKPAIAASADRQVFLAAYDANGRFLCVRTGVLAAGTDSVDIPMHNSGSIAALKCLVVDSPETMEPLADAAGFAPGV